MLLQIIDITAPVFILGFVGFIWAKSGVAYEIGFVSRLVLNISLPCLILSTLISAEIAPDALAEIALAAALGYLVAGVLLWAALMIFRLSPRVWWTASVFGNTGNIGLPLCFFAFGETGLALAMVLFAIAVFLQFTIGVWAMSGGGQWKAVFSQPMVHAAWLGCLAAIVGWEPPELVGRTLNLAGQITIPLMLITLGVSIARLEVRETGRAALVTMLRVLILGLSAVAVAWALDLGKIATGVLVLQFLTPGAVTIYMMSIRYNGSPGAVASLVLISTLLTFAVVPGVLPFLL
ncbi:MAG: AEC family transporter [Pseudomonadota bacterium]